MTSPWSRLTCHFEDRCHTWAVGVPGAVFAKGTTKTFREAFIARKAALEELGRRIAAHVAASGGR